MSRPIGTRSYEVEIRGGLVSALVEVSGRWVAATWGYAGGSPAEPPDASIVKAWRIADAEHDDAEPTEHEVAPDSLTQKDQDALIDAALMLDGERDDVGRS